MKDDISKGLLFALEEMAREQKEGKVSIGLLTKVMEGFADKLTEVEKTIANQKPPDIDTKPVTDLLKVYFETIKNLIASQPKNVVQTKQVQLFPVESFKQDFYLKLIEVVLKWAVILTVALVAIYKAYSLL